MDPSHLIALARDHVKNWSYAPAYACAHLAFQMGTSPFGNEIDDVRTLRLSDTLSHLRHRFDESMVAYILNNRMLRILRRMPSIDPRALCHLGLQLSGLLDEAGCVPLALQALALVKDVAGKFEKLVYQPGSLNRYSIYRREGQLEMEQDPFAAAFDTLSKQADDNSFHSANLPLTSMVVRTARLFRQGTKEAAETAFESLEYFVDRYRHVMSHGQSLQKPERVDSSNITQILAYSAVAACRVRPDGWEDYAHEMMTKAKYLSLETGFSHPPEFWETVSAETYRTNPSARRVLRMPRRHVLSRLRREAIDDIEEALLLLSKMIVIEKEEDALQWSSPWSGGRPRP